MSLTIVDLFSGAGGLSLGALQAGFKLVCAVETDPFALSTHMMNFPEAMHLARDVSGLSGEELLGHASAKAGSITGLIGGPPCQGFSEIGHRRVHDHRNELFFHFFRLVAELKPKFYLAENVPGILHSQYTEQVRTAIKQVSQDYACLSPLQVTASDYGVPTNRTRVFFIGYRRELVNKICLGDIEPQKTEEKVNVGQALSGLPTQISADWQTEELGWQPLAPRDQLSEYAVRISARQPDGVGDVEAVLRYQKHNEVSGCMGTKHSAEVEARYGALQQGQRDRISRSMRLSCVGLCPTLRAGTDRERGSYQAVRPIHPTQPRVITPREAARLQGFPDWFRFHRTKWHSFRQIGNSVSPIVAEALLSAIFERMINAGVT